MQAGGVGRSLSLRGAAVVCGRLDVAGPTAIEGSLYAGVLFARRPLTVTVSPDWRARPLAGLARPVIVRVAAF